MNALEDAIYDKLAAATAVTNLVSTRIYRSAAPQGAAYPFVIIQLQAGGEDNKISPDSLDITYQVRAEVSTSSADAGTIDEAIRTALHEAILTVTGWTMFYAARGQMFRSHISDADGTKRWIAGAFYRYRLTQ